MNPNDVGLGSIIIGLLIVMALATAVYMVGLWALSRMRQQRVEEETTITFPSQPQSADDRREVEQVMAKERGRAVGADNAADMALHEQGARRPSPDTATDEQLRERAVGRGMRPVSQTPDRIGERPVDADHDRGVAPRPGADAPTSGRSDRNPL